MSNPDLSVELERMKIQITPGATEVLLNSNVPQAMLVKEIKKRWEKDTTALTVKDAIDLSYSDHFSIVDNVYNFLDKHLPEVSTIIDCVSHHNPVKDPDVIQFIKSDNKS